VDIFEIAKREGEVLVQQNGSSRMMVVYCSLIVWSKILWYFYGTFLKLLNRFLHVQCCELLLHKVLSFPVVHISNVETLWAFQAGMTGLTTMKTDEG
jgi:hypothetical protein